MKDARFFYPPEDLVIPKAYKLSIPAVAVEVRGTLLDEPWRRKRDLFVFLIFLLFTFQVSPTQIVSASKVEPVICLFQGGRDALQKRSIWGALYNKMSSVPTGFVYISILQQILSLIHLGYLSVTSAPEVCMQSAFRPSKNTRNNTNILIIPLPYLSIFI